MNGVLYDAVLQALRAFYLVGLPLVIVLTVAGTVAGLLQTVLGIREQTLSYAIRLVAFIALLYVFLPSAAETVRGVAEFALK